jgi:xanthine/uracil permease
MRPGRPRGVTIALLACTVLYGLYPLLESVLYLTVEIRSGDPVAFRVIVSLLLSLVMVGLLIPAWRGRPPQIRLILSGAVIGLMLINLGLTIVDLTQEDILFDAASQAARAFNNTRLVLYPLLTLYIVWYLNRYPARQWYAGRQWDAGAVEENRR